MSFHKHLLEFAIAAFIAWKLTMGSDFVGLKISNDFLIHLPELMVVFPLFRSEKYAMYAAFGFQLLRIGKCTMLFVYDTPD